MKNPGFVIIAIVDLLLVGLLAGRILYIDNDKGSVVFIAGYGFVIILNLILWLLLRITKSNVAKQFPSILLGLFILFLPLLLILSFMP